MLALRNHLLSLNQACQKPEQIVDNMGRCVENAKKEMEAATAHDQLVAQHSLLEFARTQHPGIENRLQDALACKWSIPQREHQSFNQCRREEMELKAMEAAFRKVSAEEQKLQVETELLRVECAIKQTLLEKENESVTAKSKSKWKG